MPLMSFTTQSSPVNVTGVVNASAKTQIAAMINNAINLMPNSANGSLGIKSPTANPVQPLAHFDSIRPNAEVQLRKEFAAIIAAINAAPVV